MLVDCCLSLVVADVTVGADRIRPEMNEEITLNFKVNG